MERRSRLPPVRPLLRAEGHDVFTPSLTGIGERVHLANAQVNLTTQVLDVVNQILYEDLGDIVLLGFSYGGFVVTGALEHIAPRVRHLVYLDAFVPDDGDSVYSLTGRAPAPWFEQANSWLVAPPPRDFEDPEEGAFANPRRTPHPAGCFKEPVKLARPVEDFPFGRTYIRATGDASDAPGTSAFEAAATRARTSSKWEYREIDSNHMVPNNRPKELTRLLVALA